jgi:hypothetical protein
MAIDTSLTSAQHDDLRALAGIMIPASEGYAAPPADDPIIFADIIASLGRDAADVRAALGRLAKQAGGSFASLDPSQRQAVAESFLACGAPELTALSRAVLQCYYRDDRVMLSLGLEPRPPFPKGHTLEQGDWSLLDPVRKRPRMWRDAP